MKRLNFSRFCWHPPFFSSLLTTNPTRTMLNCSMLSSMFSVQWSLFNALLWNIYSIIVEFRYIKYVYYGSTQKVYICQNIMFMISAIVANVYNFCHTVMRKSFFSKGFWPILIIKLVISCRDFWILCLLGHMHLTC